MSQDPAQSAELTLTWIQSKLNDHFPSPVKNFDMEIIGEGTGVLGELTRIKLTLEDDSVRSVIGKFSAIVAEARQFAGDIGFYKTEVSFYKTVANEMPVSVPKAYYSNLNEETHQFVIIMEDIQGRMGDQVAGGSLEDALVVVDQLAQIHSAWADDSLLDQLKWLRPMTDQNLQTVGLAETERSIPVCAERFSEVLPDWYDEIEKRFISTVPSLTEYFDARKHTFAHGDYRLDNFVFHDKDKEVPMTIIDWQLCYRTMASFDLGYFICQSLEPEVRREHEELLVDTYVERRRQSGDNIKSEELSDELGRVALYCLTYPIVGGAIADMSKPRSRPLISAFINRVVSYIEDHDSLRYLV